MAPISLLADKGQLAQVLTNLITNAYDAMGDRGCASYHRLRRGACRGHPGRGRRAWHREVVGGTDLRALLYRQAPGDRARPRHRAADGGGTRGIGPPRRRHHGRDAIRGEIASPPAHFDAGLSPGPQGRRRLSRRWGTPSTGLGTRSGLEPGCLGGVRADVSAIDPGSLARSDVGTDFTTLSAPGPRWIHGWSRQVNSRWASPNGRRTFFDRRLRRSPHTLRGPPHSEVRFGAEGSCASPMP